MPPSSNGVRSRPPERAHLRSVETSLYVSDDTGRRHDRIPQVINRLILCLQAPGRLQMTTPEHGLLCWRLVIRKVYTTQIRW